MASTVALEQASIDSLVDAMVAKGAFGSGKSGSTSGSSGSSSGSKSNKDYKDREKIEKILLLSAKKKLKQDKLEMDFAKKKFKESGSAFRQLTSEQMELVKSTGSVTMQMQALAANSPSMALASMGDKLKSSMSHLPGAGEAFDMLGKKSTVAAVGIFAAGAALGAFGAFVMNTMETFSELSASGVYLGGGLSTLADSATNLNMNLDQFAEMATKYTRTMNMFGSSMGSAITDTSSKMRQYGLTTSETAEYMAEYLDNQRKVGVFNSLASGKNQSSMLELARQADDLSVQFGVSKDEMQKGLSEAFDDPMITSSLRSLPEAAKKSFMKSMQYFQAASPQLAKSISEMVGSEMPQLTGAFQTAMQAGVPGVAQAMSEYARKVKAGTANEEDRADMLRKMSKADTHRLRILASAGDASAQAMLSQVEAAKQAVEAERTMSPEKKQARRDLNKAQASMREFMETLRTLGTRVLGGFLSAFGSGTTDFAKRAGELGETLAEWGKKAGAFVKSFIDIMGSIPWKEVSLGLGALAAYLGVKKIKSMFGGTNKTIMAKHVTVIGGKGGKGKGKGKGGGAGRGAGKGGGSAASKVLGGAKNLATKIPLITGIYGTINGVMDGVGSAMDSFAKTGDMVEASITGAKGFATGFFDGVIGGTADLLDFVSGDAFNARENYDKVGEILNTGFDKVGSSIGGFVFDMFNDTAEETLNKDASASKPINKDNSLLERQILAQEEANMIAKVSQEINMKQLDEATKTRKSLSSVSLAGDF